MRKVGLLAVLLLLSLSGSAQKNYIMIESTDSWNDYTWYNDGGFKLLGDLPSNIKSEYENYAPQDYDKPHESITIGDLLNKLSDEGYEVKFTDMSSTYILLSKDTSKPSNNKQKRYIVLEWTREYFSISGDLPSELFGYPIDVYYGFPIKYLQTVGLNITKMGLLNMFSELGFDVEFMNRYTFILSKESSDQSSSVRNVVTNDGEPKEVARYNLQGFPVKESDKGFQIIVYSDYTAKTVIVR